MAEGVLVFIESREGEPLKVSLEALGAGRVVADQLGEPLTALLLGDDPGPVARKVSAYRPDRILTGQSPHLARFCSSSFSKGIANAVGKLGPRAVFMAMNLHGSDLAARTAARLETGQVSDCTEIVVEGKQIRAVRPVYAGKARLVVKATQEPFVLTTRMNVFDVPGVVESHEAPTESLDPGIEESDVLAPVLSFEKKQSDRPELTEASIIVSGGRGLQGPENFHLIESLANALGAAVGASRAVVDAGWRPHNEQVGQTGKTVSPDLYIACGISGAIQHLAGMSTSKVIVAINKDKEAPIFKVASYGIVGDVFDVLPAMTEQLQKQNSQEGR